MDELWELIRSIPKGRVASYGTIGESLRAPTSGRAVGRWMAHCPNGVPWWRVVARTGQLPIAKRDPGLGLLQEEILREEGVEVENLKVDMNQFALFALEEVVAVDRQRGE
jgi:methylated-DNA-protein-cysteine methyltransferase-like protein